VDKVDPITCTLDVSETLMEVQGLNPAAESSQDSGRATRVRIPRPVMQEPVQHMARYSDGGSVFTSPDGSPLRKHFRARVGFRQSRRAGLAPLRFHDLRQTAVSIAAGAHVKEICAMADQPLAAVVVNCYGHIVPTGPGAVERPDGAAVRERPGDRGEGPAVQMRWLRRLLRRKAYDPANKFNMPTPWWPVTVTDPDGRVTVYEPDLPSQDPQAQASALGVQPPGRLYPLCTRPRTGRDGTIVVCGGSHGGSLVGTAVAREFGCPVRSRDRATFSSLEALVLRRFASSSRSRPGYEPEVAYRRLAHGHEGFHLLVDQPFSSPP
jgi:hypothetical protein